MCFHHFTKSDCPTKKPNLKGWPGWLNWLEGNAGDTGVAAKIPHEPGSCALHN